MPQTFNTLGRSILLKVKTEAKGCVGRNILLEKFLIIERVTCIK